MAAWGIAAAVLAIGVLSVVTTTWWSKFIRHNKLAAEIGGTATEFGAVEGMFHPSGA